MRLWLPGWLPPGLNGPEGLLRRHWRKRSQDKLAIRGRIVTTGLWWDHADIPCNVVRGHRLFPAPRPCRIIWTRYAVRLMDFTNAAASFKNLEDVLVDLGVLEDDSPKFVTELVVRQEKVKKPGVGCSVEFLPVDRLP